MRPGSCGMARPPAHSPCLSPVTWGGFTTACLRKGSLSPKGMMLPGLPPWWESSSSSCEPPVPVKPFSCLPDCTPFTRAPGATSLAGELGWEGWGQTEPCWPPAPSESSPCSP